MDNKYKTLSIPVALYEEVEKFIREHLEKGYASVTEFFKEALREKLESEIKSKKSPWSFSLGFLL